MSVARIEWNNDGGVENRRYDVTVLAGSTTLHYISLLPSVAGTPTSTPTTQQISISRGILDSTLVGKRPHVTNSFKKCLTRTFFRLSLPPHSPSISRASAMLSLTISL